MKRSAILVCIVIMSTWIYTADVEGRGGRGGGGRGFSGGGRSFSGGRPSFSGGGPSFSGAGRSYSPSVSRAPSMSRSYGGSRGSSRPNISSGQPSFSRPSTGSGFGGSPGMRTGQLGSRSPAGARFSSPPSGRAAFSSPGAYRGASQQQLSNFLNLPGGSASARTATPANRQTRSVTTPGGSTITVGAGRGSTTTPGGVQVGGAGAGVVVQGPGGNTAARGRGAIGASDGTNQAFAAGSRAGVRGAGGGAAVSGRGVRGVTDGTNTAVRGGSFGAIRDRNGNTVGGARGGARLTDGRNTYGRGGAVGAIRSPSGNVIAGGRGAAAYNGRLVSAGQFYGVRRGFTGYGSYYTRGWYGRHPGAWIAAGVAATAWWSGAYWSSAYDYCGCASEPVSYDYGDTIVYEGDTVYYDQQPIATAEQYYQQADALAEAGSETENEDWLPLGVFAIVAGDETKFNRVLQLAVNKEGVIRGNLSDKLTNQVTPIEGSVDKETQRVAFRPTENKEMVAECGLYNLTQDALTILVHLGKDQTETRKLIRLEQPEDDAEQN